MEALGIRAALTEILKVLRGGIEFCRSFSEAPWQLRELANQFRLLETEVTLFQLLICRSNKWLQFDRREVRSLNQYICDAGQELRHIQAALTKEVRQAIWKKLLRWTHYGKDKTESLLRKLARLVSSINLVLDLVSKAKLEGVGAETGLSLLAARASELDTHRLRSGSLSQAKMRLTLPADGGGFAWQTLGLEDFPRASHSTSSLYGSQPKTPTRIVLRLRLTNWLAWYGSYKGSDTSGGLVTLAAPVMQAAQSGDILALRRILRTDRTARYSFTVDKLTPIAVAVQHGQLAVVQLLLKKGVDMEAKFGRFEINALAQALRCRRFDIARLLVERGASFSSRNIAGWSPFFYLWAAEVNPPASHYVDLLRTRPDFPLLHDDVYDSDGWTVMHRAACFGTAGDVKHLIRHGLDPFGRIRPTEEETECDNWTVLHAAVWYGARASVNVLALHYVKGPGIDVTDGDGCTPLHLAVLRKQLGIAAILLRHGADALRKTIAAWQSTTNDAIGVRYNAVMLAAEAGRDFQQQFGALISEACQSNTQSTLPNMDLDCEVEYAMVKIDPRLSEEPTSSIRPQHGPPGHHYPAIYVSGNACVQLGDQHYYGRCPTDGNVIPGGNFAPNATIQL